MKDVADHRYHQGGGGPDPCLDGGTVKYRYCAAGVLWGALQVGTGVRQLLRIVENTKLQGLHPAYPNLEEV